MNICVGSSESGKTTTNPADQMWKLLYWYGAFSENYYPIIWMPLGVAVSLCYSCERNQWLEFTGADGIVLLWRSTVLGSFLIVQPLFSLQFSCVARLFSFFLWFAFPRVVLWNSFLLLWQTGVPFCSFYPKAFLFVYFIYPTNPRRLIL